MFLLFQIIISTKLVSFVPDLSVFFDGVAKSFGNFYAGFDQKLGRQFAASENVHQVVFQQERCRVFLRWPVN